LIEQIPLSVGVEQIFTLNYSGTVYKFELLHDDYEDCWFVNITDNATEAAILTGIYLRLGLNALLGLEYLGLGSLGLFDTQLTNSAAITKADLGNRVKLYREVL